MSISNNSIKLHFLCFFLLPIIISCSQRSTSDTIQKSSENLETQAEIAPDSFDIKVDSLMKAYKIPGASFAFIKDGVLHSTRSYGFLQKGAIPKINEETMFSVGSISKVVNAMLVLKLVDEGKLKLDEDINQYLIDWKVKDNKYTKDNRVTLRAILSHTAGFSVHGFEDFLPGEAIPTTLQILNGESPAKNEKIALIHPVGSKYKYSGGGIMVSQKIVEDVTGLPYYKAAQKYLFEPLGLKRSSFENPLPKSWNNIAKAHDENGDKVALPRGYQAMPEAAASGLWSTSSDLAKILIAFYNSKEDKNKNNFFSSKLCKEMVTKVTPSNFGLGPKLSVLKGDKLMQHAGANDSYKAYFCFFHEKGSGYIIFTNGSNGMDFLMNPIDFYTNHTRSL